VNINIRKSDTGPDLQRTDAARASLSQTCCEQVRDLLALLEWYPKAADNYVVFLHFDMYHYFA